MDAFRTLDYVLLFGGCDIFSRSHVRTISNMQRAILAATYVVCFVGDAMILFNSSNWNEDLYDLMYYLSSYVCGLLFLLIMLCKRKAIRKTVRQLCRGISKERHRRLHRLAKAYVTVVLLVNLAIGGSFIEAAIKHHGEGEYDVFNTVVWYFYYYNITCNRWPLLSCFLIAFFVDAHTAFELSFLHQLLIRMHQQPSDTSREMRISSKGSFFFQVQIELHDMYVQKIRLMSLFGVIPCIFVAYLFGATTSLLLEITYLGFNVDMLIEVPTVLLYILTLAYVALVCDQCRRQVMQKGEEVKTAMIGTRDEEWKYAMQPLTRLTSYTHHSCHVFDINCRFIMTFITTLITFTALAVQFSVQSAPPAP